MDSPGLLGQELRAGLKTPKPHSEGIPKDASNGGVTSKSFGGLPTEIRLLIWEFCIPQGRLIRVKAWAYDRPTDRYRFRLELEEDRSVPLLFNICRETRQIAQRTFLLGFSNIRDTKHLYWSPQHDVFYLNLRTLRIRNPQYSRVKTLQESLVFVQNLGLRMGPGLWYSLTVGLCVEWLHGFPNLKHLRLIIEPREGCGPWDWTNLPNDVGISGIIGMENIMPPGPSTLEASKVLPAYVESVVAQKFEQYGAMSDPGWMPPTVEVYHMSEFESCSQYQS